MAVFLVSAPSATAAHAAVLPPFAAGGTGRRTRRARCAVASARVAGDAGPQPAPGDRRSGAAGLGTAAARLLAPLVGGMAAGRVAASGARRPGGSARRTFGSSETARGSAAPRLQLHFKGAPKEEAPPEQVEPAKPPLQSRARRWVDKLRRGAAGKLLTELEDQREELAARLNKADQRVEELRRDLSLRDEALLTSQEALRARGRELDEVAKIAGQKEFQLSKAMDEAQALRRAYEELNDELEGSQTQSSREIEALKAELAAAQQKLQDAAKANGTLDQKLAKQKVELEELTEKSVGLAKDRDQARSDLQVEKTRARQTESRLTEELEQARASLNVIITRLESAKAKFVKTVRKQ